MGVFTLSRPRRYELAEQLVAQDIGKPFLDELQQYLAECVSDAVAAQRAFVGIVTKPEGLPFVREDLEARRRIQAAQRKPAEELESDHGAAVRARDMERVRKFEQEWAAYEKERREKKS